MITAMSSASDDDRISRLEDAGTAMGVSAAAIAETLEGLGKETGGAIAGLRKLGRQNRRMIKALAACMAGLLLTMGGMVYVGLRGMEQRNEISRIQDRTSDEALCPLYEAFRAQQNNPIPNHIKDDPEQIRERAEAFEIINRGYDVLGCGKD